MKKALWSLLALAATPAWAGYQYYVTDSLQSINPSAWSSSGQLSPGAAGLAATSASGGSLISSVPIPGGGSDAEVAITISLNASGGVYTAFLQASSDARTGSSASGSYLAFEMQNPQFDAENKNCSANFLLLQSVAGKVSALAAFSHSCRNGMRMRMALHGGVVLIWPDQPAAMEFYIAAAATASGQPGFGAYGVPSANSIALVQLGAIDQMPPSAVVAGTLAASVFRTRVELKWAAAADDPNGIGLAGYWVYRDGLYLGRTSNTYLLDETVKAGETHSYSVQSLDGHFNFAPPAAISVTIPTQELTPITTTPPATPPPGAPPAPPAPGAPPASTAPAAPTEFGRATAHVTVGTPQADSGGGLDPRRIGVRALGSYWGGGGENIDAVSGNMNLTIPLLSPTGRNGAVTPIALSYNSQIWRQDSTGVTLLGQDTGFGLGWKLQAGAITPVLTVSGTIDHYLYSDSTGAEYSLNVNNGSNVWTSQEGIYVSFDASADRLYFTDGSYWWMASVSSAAEADAGTMYPTNFYDTNGNEIVLMYAQGKGSGNSNTSARMIYIWDARCSTGSPPAYIFAYNSDSTPHLTQEQGVFAPAESYNFTYIENQPLYEPFFGAYKGTATLLATAATWMGPGSTFAYTPSYGELQQYTSPLGGILQWQYRSFTYPSGIGMREVVTRTMQSTASDSPHTYTFSHDDSCCSLHTWSAILDNGAQAWKYWQFVTSGTGYALESGYWELHPRHIPAVFGDWTTLLWRATGWSTANGNLYANGSNTAVCDVNDTNVQWADSTQVLDSYGNLTAKYLYSYNNTSSTMLTYYLYYLTDPNYTSRHITNRLTSASVIPSSGYWTNLVQNTYDQYSTSCGGQSGLVPRNGAVLHDDTNYGAGFTYRGNVTSSTSLAGSFAMQYESTGVAVCTQNGAGLAVTAAPSSSTNYSLPGVMTPNTTSALSTTVSYNTMWAATSVVNPNGATATTTYDSWGRPTQSTMPDGAQTNYTYSYYPSLNQQTAVVNTGAGRWKRTTLDGFGRVTMVESGTGATTNTPVSQVDTKYAPAGCSPLGQVSQVSMPHVGGTQATAWTTYAYDERGRITSVTAPDGSVTQYLYNANQVTIWDAAMKWKTQTFDPVGNLINVTEPDTPNGFTNSTTYTYDGIHQILTVSSQTASGTQNRSFAYSGRDMTRATNPENGTVFYTYDGAHHVLSKTDAMGQQTHYSYDNYGRLTAKYCYPLVNGQLQLDPNQTVLYSYDTNPHEPGFSTNSQGRLTAVQMNTNQWYEYNYTVPGRVQNQRLQVAGHDYDASYVWDQEGRLTSQTWPSAVSPSTGPQYQFQYDSMGRVGSMQDASNNTVATASYGVANELLGLTYFGINEQLTYNSMFQLIHQYAPGGVIDMQYIYTAGQNNGRIATSIDNGLPETVNYTYDSLNRLINAAATDGAFSQSYTYDGFGNLTSKSAAGFYPAYSATFNPANNQQIGVAYDANGNQTQQGTYDVSNRLVTSSIGQSYNYDYRGKRIVKWTGGTAEVYFYGIDGKKLTTLQCDSYLNCSSAAYNVSFAGKLVQSKGNTVATDRLGSVRWTAGPVGYVYFPYGEERTISPDDTEKFGTYTRDSSGQDYADQRYYGVGTGRFFTVDPGGIGTAHTGNPSSWNRYAYVNGDPVNFGDPTGEDPCGPNQTWDGEGCIDGGDGAVVLPTITTITYPSVCTQGQVLTANGDCADPDASYAQQVLGQAYGLTSGLTEPSTYAAVVGAAIATASGALLLADLPAVTTFIAATGLGAEAPSVLTGDIQASFNFGASVQPTINTTIEGLNRTYGGQSVMEGPWLSPEPPGVPAIPTLSLPPGNAATSVASATITPGATIVSGTAAPAFGQPGGGFQIYATPLSCIIFAPFCP